VNVVIIYHNLLFSARIAAMLAKIKGIQGIQNITTVLEETDIGNVISVLDPEFIIIEIESFKEDSLMLLHKVREKTKKAKLVVFTNYPSRTYYRYCIASGADYCLDKDNQIEECRTLIANLMIKQQQKTPRTFYLRKPCRPA